MKGESMSMNTQNNKKRTRSKRSGDEEKIKENIKSKKANRQ